MAPCLAPIKAGDVTERRVLFDSRWSGPHGIGRFSLELAHRIEHQPFPLQGRPMSPLDPILLASALSGRAHDSIFLSPGFNAPLWGDTPFVISIHDLNHIDFPQSRTLTKRFFYATVLRRACRRAAAILTVSDFSRHRIIEWAGVSNEKIFNVGNGVSPAFHSGATRHLPGFLYFLCVGNRKAHKNEPRVVAAFARANLNRNTRLLFTGDPSPQLTAIIRDSNLTDRVVFVGRLSEAKLAEVYRGALGLIFPSLYEGFGLPVIEAFACGTPVITSAATSLTEISAGAALTVDPLSVDAIAEAIARIADDAQLRARLTADGERRAKFYTWAGVAGRVKDALATLSPLCSTDDVRRHRPRRVTRGAK